MSVFMLSNILIHRTIQRNGYVFKVGDRGLSHPDSDVWLVLFRQFTFKNSTVSTMNTKHGGALPHYTFTELACAYFPRTQKVSTARKNLKNWIMRKPGMWEELMDCGFHPSSRVEMPPRAVALIFEAFDVP